MVFYLFSQRTSVANLCSCILISLNKKLLICSSSYHTYRDIKMQTMTVKGVWYCLVHLL